MTQVWRGVSHYVLTPDHPHALHVLLLNSAFEGWDTAKQVIIWLPAHPASRSTPPCSPFPPPHLICDQGLVLQGPIPVWSPTPEGIADTNLAAFMQEFQARYILPCP